MRAVLFLCVLFTVTARSVYSQQQWRSAGTLVDNKSYKISVEYLFSADPCGPSRFRYQFVRRSLKKDVFIYWRFDYLNCDNELLSKDVKLDLPAAAVTGVLENSAYVFPGNKVVRDAYEFLETERPIIRQAVKATSPYSVEPKMIAGENVVDRGSFVTLTLKGGYLAPGAVWKWYQGACSGLFVDTGRSIRVRPAQRTVYFVRAEGKNSTACMSFPVDVTLKNITASGITGKDLICLGETNVRLSVNGGRLGDGGKWVWYEGDCNGPKVGEGSSVSVSPLVTTSYYVRAESPTHMTDCQMHKVVVTSPSVAPKAINGLNEVNTGDPVTLSVDGGALADDAKWVWYSGGVNAFIPAGSGPAITVYPTSQMMTYYVRAEGLCNSTDFATKTIKTRAVKRYAAARPPFVFINAGLVADDPNKLNAATNYVATLGGGRNIGWFVRAKFTTEKSAATYETANGAYIENYNVPGYYQYNGKILNKRTAYTGGLYFGTENIAVYLGGGYGTRELLWGIDQYDYGNAGLVATSWIKNTANSYSSFEAESGLILKYGYLNLMVGVSSIQGKYTDYNLGIGLNF